jgi:hypothetical protein
VQQEKHRRRNLMHQDFVQATCKKRDVHSCTPLFPAKSENGLLPVPVRVVNSTFAAGSRIVNALDMDAKGTNFFQALLDELYLREPTLRPTQEAPNPEAR